MGHTTKPCPFQGELVIYRLGLTTINQWAKFGISTFTRCEDRKGDENMEIVVYWGFGVTQGNRQHSYSMGIIQLLLNFNRNYASIL